MNKIAATIDGPFRVVGLDITHANRRRQGATRAPNRRYIPIAWKVSPLLERCAADGTPLADPKAS